jgi:hypothetical protein
LPFEAPNLPPESETDLTGSTPIKMLYLLVIRQKKGHFRDFHRRRKSQMFFLSFLFFSVRFFLFLFSVLLFMKFRAGTVRRKGAKDHCVNTVAG